MENGQGKRRLSVREIILIYVAVLLAVFSGGYYLLLLPAKEECQEAMARYEEASQSQMLNDSLLGMAEELEERFGREKAYYLADREELAPPMSAIEMETETLKLMEKHGIVPFSVSVEDIVILEEEGKKQGSEASGMEPVLKKGSVSIVASGTWHDFFQLMDDFNEKPGSCVSSFGLHEKYDVDQQILSTPEGGAYDIQFTVDYYMANGQPEIEAAVGQ